MGRPREFKPDEVLTDAYEVFWAKGYQGTSTRALSEATGLTAASIYNAYGDKRGLFIAAMGHYLDNTVRDRIARHSAMSNPADAITGYFRETVKRALADPHHRGCLLVNTALEVTSDDIELQTLVINETKTISAFFRRTIIAGQKSGAFPTNQSADDIANNLMALILGLRVLARIGADAKLFDSLIRPALAQLGLRWTNSKTA
jgi:TetR/AcrR family transcriptional repressor of nem operon